MKPTTMQVQAIKHSDVRGKEQLYLKISYAGNDVIINIGKTTFEAIENLSHETTKPNATNKQQELADKLASKNHAR